MYTTKKNVWKVLDSISFLYSYIGFVLIAFGVVFLLIPSLPYLYYKFNTEASSDEVTTIANFAPSTTPAPKPTTTIIPLPEVNPTLTKTNTLKINKIGVNGSIHEGKDMIKQLYKGIWRVPDFGNPIMNERSIILAAHRYGYIEWSADFRKTNSFANLPRLKKGDKVDIIWEQRKFTYEVYRVTENSKITDYEADLIMYTCKYLKSPVRIIVYARRVSN